MSDLIPVGRIGKRFWLKKRKKIQLEGGKYGSTSKKEGCQKKKTRTRIDFQASDSGVGSHSPSPDLASDGEESPRNKRYDVSF